MTGRCGDGTELDNGAPLKLSMFSCIIATYFCTVYFLAPTIVSFTVNSCVNKRKFTVELVAFFHQFDKRLKG